MPIFKLFAPETVHLLSGHILPRIESNFTHTHLDFRDRGGVIGMGGEKEGRGQRQGGDLALRS